MYINMIGINSNKIIDKLSIVHFIIYLVFGITIKNKYKLVLLGSILWEVSEYILSNIKYTRNLLIKCWPIPEKYWNEKLENKVLDIIINMLGYYIGNKIIF